MKECDACGSSMHLKCCTCPMCGYSDGWGIQDLPVGKKGEDNERLPKMQKMQRLSGTKEKKANVSGQL